MRLRLPIAFAQAAQIVPVELWLLLNEYLVLHAGAYLHEHDHTCGTRITLIREELRGEDLAAIIRSDNSCYPIRSGRVHGGYTIKGRSDAMKKTLLAASSCAFLLIAASPGIRPRADADRYPSHQQKDEYSIGAALIPQAQAKKMFAANLDRAGYLVVEVGVFPAPGKDVDLYPTDFTLYVGENAPALRAVDGDTIAGILTGSKDDVARVPRTGPHDINTSAGIGIGRASYPDPVTGRQTHGTVTETTAGVGIGGPAPCGRYDCGGYPSAPPASSTTPTQKRANISQELWEKSLPDGKTAQPVAGYLYFPKPPGRAKDAAWELRYEPPSGRTKLPLQK
jgi:hypothetical protein